MPYYESDRTGGWCCSYCHGGFFDDEESAREHERFYCDESMLVEESWEESPMNPKNRHCATCERTTSFLTPYGQYNIGHPDMDCPQRDKHELDREFPCEAHVRGVKAVALGFKCNVEELPEVLRRYLRSFGIKA